VFTLNVTLSRNLFDNARVLIEANENSDVHREIILVGVIGGGGGGAIAGVVGDFR
jgi:hypothetical protein